MTLQLQDAQASRDSLAASISNQFTGASRLDRAKLAKLDKQIAELQAKLHAPEARLQQDRARLQQLQQQLAELQVAATSEADGLALQHLSDVCDSLSQAAATAAGLLRGVAAAFGADAAPAAAPGPCQQLSMHMQLAEAVGASTGAASHPQVAEPIAMCSRLLCECEHLQGLSQEFVPGGPVQQGLTWLEATLRTAIGSLSSCLQALPAQQQFSQSRSGSVLRQHAPALQLLSQALLQDLQQLTKASLAKGSSAAQVQQLAASVLRFCQLCPPGVSPKLGTLQHHLVALRAAGLGPAAAAVTSLLRLSVLLALASCRLTRCQQPLHSAGLDDVTRSATGLARQLGLDPALADMPADAAPLAAFIRQQQRYVPYVAEQLDGRWLLLQSQQQYLGGPVALLQDGNLLLSASTRAFLPASWLSARFADVLDAMGTSLFEVAEQQVGDSSGTSISGTVASEADVQLQRSRAAQCLTASDVSALLQLLQSFMQLAQHDVSVSAETALLDGGASLLLDAFKAHTLVAVDVLKQGREELQPCCSRLSQRSELLQKEVLKAEVSLVQSTYRQQLSTSLEQHLQELQDTPPEQLWQQVPPGWAGLPDAAGWQPAWDRLQLVAVAQLPVLLRILADGAPPEAAGQLVPGSPLVLAWFGQHQAVEACLRHGLEAQGDLLRSVYDFCPQVRKCW